MALIGSIGEFDESRETWPQYAKRLTHFLAANGITTAAKKTSAFLAVIGPDTFKLLESLLAPENPEDKSITELVDTLTKHYSPEPSVIMERYKFYSRQRKPGESVATYLSELRRLAKTCKFDGNLSEMLRDKLVVGLGDGSIQRRLLQEKNLTLENATELALQTEAATKELQLLRQETTPSAGDAVHKVRRGAEPPQKSTPKKPAPTPASNSCYRCGKKTHEPSRCPFRTKDCFYCKKRGHTQAVCRSKQKAEKVQQLLTYDESDTHEEYDLFQVHGSSRTSQPLEVPVEIEGRPLVMELDTGAAVSLISESVFNKLCLDKPFQLSSSHLRTYSGETLPVLGQLQVKVTCGDQQARLPLHVVAGHGSSLLGRDWLRTLRLDWNCIRQVQNTVNTNLHSLLQKHQAVFSDQLGLLKGFEAKIHVDPSAKPVFCRARSVPYSMKLKVEEALDRLVKDEVLEPVQFASWAAPIVPIVKPDKSVRICGDFRLTVNQASKLDQYPLPRIEDLFSNLSGGKTFSKLDLSQAYQQLALSEDSKQYLVINTHKGLYRYNRLPFGVSSAPAIFQRVMESLLKGIDGVVVYIDDILVTGKTEEEHLSTLGEVLTRLQSAGLHLKKEKCKFLCESVTYLGHRIDANGLSPLPEKVAAVRDAPVPKNVAELKSYLGLLSYYSRFLSNLSTVLAPLYRLLRQSTSWQWGTTETAAFQSSKELLLSAPLLVHYDPSMDITLACDASSYGIGAVLSHELPDGSEKPIGFISRSLSDTEKRYPQIEKEALSCVFAVKKFHSYLCGHHFTLITDHKPLTTLFSEKKAISSQASGRIQRWSLTLSAYEYEIQYRSTTKHGNADAMSRLPLPVKPSETPTPPESILLIENVDSSPITSAQIKLWTRRDPLLSRVLRHLREGWPVSCSDPALQPYFNKRLELTVQDGCLLWGGRVIVPPPGREPLLGELHGGHPGISRMKTIARMFIWWPGLDTDIEKVVKHCNKCQQQRPSPPVAPLHPWKWPSHPWTRLHLDFAGPFLGHMFLIVVDSHSKWVEVSTMSTSTSRATINQLRHMFARFGIPVTIVTDNAATFTSDEFAEFLKKNGVQHVRPAPYHPSTNGLAERAVQSFKQGMKKLTAGTVEERVARYLFHYRNTPHSTTGQTPSELLLGHRPRSRLDLLFPDLSSNVTKAQQRQKAAHDSKSADRSFQLGDTVYSKAYSRGQPKWVPAIVVQKTGPVSYLVQLDDTITVKRHLDQLRKRDAPLPLPKTPQSTPVPTPDTPVSNSSEHSDISVSDAPDEIVTPRYPSRIRNPPDRLTYQNF